MVEGGIEVEHSTINRWVWGDAPQLDKRIRPDLNPKNDLWRVDETYIQVKGKWKDFYRAVDAAGNTRDLMLSAKRDSKAATRFCGKTLKPAHTQLPPASNVAQNAAAPNAVETLPNQETLSQTVEWRQNQYLNNLVEPDHRNLKRVVKPMMGFKSFHTARRTWGGIEAMNMIRQGQVSGISQHSVSQAKLSAELLGVSA